MEMRDLGYQGRIVSFEPLQAAFAELVRYAHYDSRWTAQNIAIGAYDGKVTINISENFQSSSVLDMLPATTQVAPQARFVGQQEVAIHKIDTILDDFWKPGERLYLKIDTQGYEKDVIEGAKQSLHNIIGVQMEASLIPLYARETLFPEMIDYMISNGYLLMGLEPEFSNSVTGQLLQSDCIFYRQELA
jgi:FkbM family methyltransferase